MVALHLEELALPLLQTQDSGELLGSSHGAARSHDSYKPEMGVELPKWLGLGPQLYFKGFWAKPLPLHVFLIEFQASLQHSHPSRKSFFISPEIAQVC